MRQPIGPPMEPNLASSSETGQNVLFVWPAVAAELQQGKMKSAALQTGPCGVIDLCKYQDWMDRNTNQLAGKTVPYMYFICVCSCLPGVQH